MKATRAEIIRKFPLAGVSERVARDKREALAKQYFGFTDVLTAVLEARDKGEMVCRIRQKEPISLENTKRAKSLLRVLEAKGYRCRWADAQRAVVGGQHEKMELFSELEIAWGDFQYGSTDDGRDLEAPVSYYGSEVLR